MRMKRELARPADAAMMPALKALWISCFGDDERYADLVFEKLLRPERMLVITDEADWPIAMLCIEPVRVWAAGEPLSGAYVYGVATDPAYRGKGLSTRLMEGMDRHLQGQGARLAMLVPASESLFHFYAARGYRTAFSYRKVSVERWQIPAQAPSGVLSPVALEQLEALRREHFAGSALFADWGRDWLRYTGEECRWLGGEVLRYNQGGQQGYVVCYPLEDRLLVKELAVRPQGLDGLLRALDARYRKGRVELRLPVDFPTARPGLVLPFGMVKWYDREQEERAGPGAGSAPWLAFVLD